MGSQRVRHDWATFTFTSFLMVLVVKNLPANAGDVRDSGSIPGSGRSPGGGHDNPLQYSCLENPMDRGAWWATIGSQRVGHNGSNSAHSPYKSTSSFWLVALDGGCGPFSLLFMDLTTQLDSVLPSLSAVCYVPWIMLEVVWLVGRSVGFRDQSLWALVPAMSLLWTTVSSSLKMGWKQPPCQVVVRVTWSLEQSGVRPSTGGTYINAELAFFLPSCFPSKGFLRSEISQERRWGPICILRNLNTEDFSPLPVIPSWEPTCL